MKLTHFHAFEPLCPRCRAGKIGDFPLNIAWTLEKTDKEILHGALVCSNPACQCEYPIIDGVPYLFPDVRKFLCDHHMDILVRDDLPVEIQSILHEAAGGASWLGGTRQQLSAYMHGHYAPQSSDKPDGVAQLIQHALSPLSIKNPRLALDVGSSVGRGTFELASQTGALALGVDANPQMLRKAASTLRNGKAVYDLRHSGLLYERREVPFPSDAASLVDFWACDAMALPFADRGIDCVVAMNVIDCVVSPVALLGEVFRIAGKSAALCSPWDWNSAVTPEENWIGGHSPRARCAGDSLQLLKGFLPSHLKIIAEHKNLPWRVHVHDKHEVDYKIDLLVLESID